MTQYITDSTVKKGHIELDNIPLPDNSEVKVYVIPKTNIDNLSFEKIMDMTKSITGKMSDDIITERGE